VKRVKKRKREGKIMGREECVMPLNKINIGIIS
jgi:hypothetical protein